MQQLIHEAQQILAIKVTRAQAASFEVYQRELDSWNQRINLTAVKDPDEVRIKHFIDSLSCLLAMQGTPMQYIVDIGTGPGFPGLPLKILYPEIQLTLVESIGKKTAFLEHVVQVLDLEGVEVLQMRAEEVGRLENHRERYDWAAARAVASLPVLAEYLLPLVKIGGRMLAQKGETGHAEAQTAENAIGLLGGELREIVPVTLPGVVEQRCLVVVDKLAATPDQYPRRVGVPAKRPL